MTKCTQCGREELNKTKIGIILQKLGQSDCGSNSCLFYGRGKGGMRTNGGCDCWRKAKDEIFKTLVQPKKVRFKDIQEKLDDQWDVMNK